MEKQKLVKNKLERKQLLIWIFRNFFHDFKQLCLSCLSDALINFYKQVATIKAEKCVVSKNSLAFDWNKERKHCVSERNICQMFVWFQKKKDFNSEHSNNIQKCKVIAPFSELILACLAKKKWSNQTIEGIKMIQKKRDGMGWGIRV